VLQYAHLTGIPEEDGLGGQQPTYQVKQQHGGEA
jgi:hypothetical protein